MSKKQTGVKKSMKPKLAPVHAFNLDSISLSDLKTYVSKLEKEHALMTKERAFYITNKDKIMDFLMTIRSVYETQKETSLAKNSHIDNLIEQLQRFSETYYEKTIINDKERARKKLEKTASEFLERNTAKSQHFDEEYDLKQQIFDMDKQLERSQYLCETAVKDRKELFRKAEEELDSRYSKLLENSLKQYVNESLRSRKDFNADRIKMLFSFWNIKEQPGDVRESFLNEIKDMQNFFYEISWNNNEVVKMLKNKLNCLLIKEKKLNISIKETMHENMKLQHVRQPGFYNSKNVNAPVQYPGNIENEQDKKKFEKLQLKNDVLKAHLCNIKENWKNLRKQFISAARMVYQTTDFKALILEEIIIKKLQMECVESKDEEPEKITTQKQVEEKDDAIEDGINVLSLTIEDSDTIYVPPVYHESWDPSLRKHFRKKYQRCPTIKKVEKL